MSGTTCRQAVPSLTRGFPASRGNGFIRAIDGTSDSAFAVQRREVTTLRNRDALDVDPPGGLVVAGDEKRRTAVQQSFEIVIEHNTDKPRVRISANEDGHVIRNADDGPGLPEQERAVVPDEGEIPPLEHTSGLGLWPVKWVVESTGGAASFEHSDESDIEVVVELREPNSEVDFE